MGEIFEVAFRALPRPPATITIEVTDDQLALLERLADREGMTVPEYAADALRRQMALYAAVEGAIERIGATIRRTTT